LEAGISTLLSSRPQQLEASILVNFLLEHGAEVNDGPSEYLPITGAARAGNIAIVRRLVEAGADVNLAWGPSGETALQKAAGIEGTLEMVQVLLDEGTDVNVRVCLQTGTALQFAVCSNTIEVVQIILSHGADANAPAAIPEGMTAVEGAVYKEDLAIIAGFDRSRRGC
jgi:ankyrin repeat protein